MNFTLYDTLNRREISRHSSIKTAVLAQIRIDQNLRNEYNGLLSLPTVILFDGEKLNKNQQQEVENFYVSIKTAMN
jgi:hypothetical protein